MNNKNKQKGKNVNPTTSRPIRARGKTKRIRQDDEKVPEERGQNRNNPSRGHRRNVSRNEARFKEQEKEKEIMKIVIDERPKLFVFETEDEDNNNLYETILKAEKFIIEGGVSEERREARKNNELSSRQKYQLNKYANKLRKEGYSVVKKKRAKTPKRK